jgi:small subunit ribosomal protein S17
MSTTRRRLDGVVVSNKMQKTVVVEITRRYRHPLYHKVVTSAKRVKAHDELNCVVGDEVTIVETRPISKTKRWAVEEITKRNERAENLSEA